MKPFWIRLLEQLRDARMTDIRTLKKGDEICVSVVGWIDSFSWYSGNDVVCHIVDIDGNFHAISLKSPTSAVTKLSKGQE